MGQAGLGGLIISGIFLEFTAELEPFQSSS